MSYIYNFNVLVIKKCKFEKKNNIWIFVNGSRLWCVIEYCSIRKIFWINGEFWVKLFCFFVWIVEKFISFESRVILIVN